VRRTLLFLTLPALLTSCGVTTHMTDSLTCLGFCQHTRVEHETKPEPKKENLNEQAER
jgi:hypothetical protein